MHIEHADNAGQGDIHQSDPEMVGEQADDHEQKDIPDREGGEGADGVLERGVHHRVLDLVGEPLRDEVRQEIVEIAEKEKRQREDHQENTENEFGP